MGALLDVTVEPGPHPSMRRALPANLWPERASSPPPHAGEGGEGAKRPVVVRLAIQGAWFLEIDFRTV
ncbi:hypothetical protein J2W68_000630 [Luteimonas terrae]|uniref:Uncharacterized protein n=1 Tax=Luteimonas terrae TaxID=1530191 RepID=A0ABU1XT35_9GAMM|nr:hypothetical protein [Luteimonas terrae]